MYVMLCFLHHDFIIYVYYFIYLFVALYRPQSIAFFSFDLYFVSRAAVSAF